MPSNYVEVGDDSLPRGGDGVLDERHPSDLDKQFRVAYLGEPPAIASGQDQTFHATFPSG
jgi:hypothetical protein